MAKKTFKVVKKEVVAYETTVEVDIPDEYLKPGCGTVVHGLVMCAADEKGYDPVNNGIPEKQPVRFAEIIDGKPCMDLDKPDECWICGAKTDDYGRAKS